MKYEILSPKWLESFGDTTVQRRFFRSSGICSAALGNVTASAELGRKSILYPEFDMATRVRCGRCYISCRDGGHQAIKLVNGRIPQPIREKCVGCHFCRLVCLVGSIREGERVLKQAVPAAKIGVDSEK